MHLLQAAHVRCRWGFASAFYILFRNDQVTCCIAIALLRCYREPRLSNVPVPSASMTLRCRVKTLTDMQRLTHIHHQCINPAAGHTICQHLVG